MLELLSDDPEPDNRLKFRKSVDDPFDLGALWNPLFAAFTESDGHEMWAYRIAYCVDRRESVVKIASLARKKLPEIR